MDVYRVRRHVIIRVMSEKTPRIRPHERQLRPLPLSAHQQAKLGQLSLLRQAPMIRGDESHLMDLAETLEEIDNAAGDSVV